MTIRTYRCHVLSDIIISESSASEGRHKCIDYIPGNNFLGIAANSIYTQEGESDRTFRIFHSGKVRFGDAHPAYYTDNSQDPDSAIRSLKIPASFYYPKLETIFDRCFVYHSINQDDDNLRKLQLKQSRSGFYAFYGNDAQEIKNEKCFSIKTAYDTKCRRSKDSEMFGYESIRKGSDFIFEVAFDDDIPSEEIELVSSSLQGDKHIGRSRSAEYGWINISEIKKKTPASSICNQNKESKSETIVYAESRLIFFDKEGMPSFRPNAQMLGFNDSNAVIDWSRSQIRTFQYSPWNFKRQSFDSDRCGIEKGSVFVVKTSQVNTSDHEYVGAYQNEGFGKVLYNPYFITDVDTATGESRIHFHRQTKANEESQCKTTDLTVKTPLILYLEHRKRKDMGNTDVYRYVNNFVQENIERFRSKSDRFASQWGTIRGIAMSSKPEDIKKNISEYIGHGIAQDKWQERKRRECLENFIEECSKVKNIDLKELVINLASEMSKKLI